MVERSPLWRTAMTGQNLAGDGPTTLTQTVSTGHGS
jgi:hypothetical protein